MNLNKILIPAISLLIIGAYLFGKNQSYTPTTSTQKPSVAPATQSSVKVIDNSLNEDNTDQKYTIHVKYPQIEGLQNAQTQIQVNQSIKDIIDKVVSDFKQTWVVKGYKSNSVISGGYAKGMLNISYDIAQANNSIISIQFGIYEFTGGAHGMQLDQTFNYDVSSSKQLQLSGLFKPNSNYLERISEISIKDLENQSQINCPDCPTGPTDLIHQGASPNENNFDLFTLDKDALVLIFNPYQVAGYAQGQKKVKIPYKDIQDILNPLLNMR